MMHQCVLEDQTRKCLADFQDRCFTKNNQQMRNGSAICENQVNKLVEGCSANSSMWHSQCADPLMESLHAFLMVDPRDKMFSLEKGHRIQQNLCCSLKSFYLCVTEKAKAECNMESQETFQNIIKGMKNSYQCDDSKIICDRTVEVDKTLSSLLMSRVVSYLP